MHNACYYIFTRQNRNKPIEQSRSVFKLFRPDNKMGLI